MENYNGEDTLHTALGIEYEEEDTPYSIPDYRLQISIVIFLGKLFTETGFKQRLPRASHHKELLKMRFL